MLFKKSRLLVGIALATAALFGQATDWVDRGEYELVAEQIGKATDPAKKLELLNQWKQKYPKTNFGWQRLGAYLVTYQQLGKAKEMFDTAKEMTAADPKNFTGPYYITLLVLSMGSTDAAVMDLAVAVSGLLSGRGAGFGTTKSLSVRYLAPTPLGHVLRCEVEAAFDRSTGLGDARARLTDGEQRTVYAEADAVLVDVKLRKRWRDAQPRL